ncbi:Putative membrane protein [Massilia sp. 9I]|nr:Putative membrane protein [Massilia sp. 9I]
MRVPAAVLTGALLMSPLTGAQVAPPDHHPIVGIWKLSLPDLGCSETYRFRPDGTTLVTSAQEISESEYRIPAKPSARGYYRLEDRITKDNGKKDCAGAIMKPGTTATNFIRFHPSNAIFLMCADESMETCIGPFERVQGEEA